MNILNKFPKDYNEFIDIIYNAYWSLPTIHKEKYSKALESMVLNVLEGRKPSFDLTLEDLKQEMCFFWIKHEKDYMKNKERKNISLRSYIIRRSMWSVRDWLKRHNSIVKTDIINKTEDRTAVGFKLNLRFLLEGSNNRLLKDLSGYERYIIFLVFKEEKNMVEMSKILQRDRRAIKNHYEKILERIKGNYENANKKRNG